MSARGREGDEAEAVVAAKATAPARKRARRRIVDGAPAEEPGAPSAPKRPRVGLSLIHI